MHRYWIKFRISMRDPHPPGTLPGIGVTARNREEALELVQERVFRDLPLPAVVHFEQDVAVGALDPRHVVPNMGNPSVRGVWFPLGYS